MLRYKRAERVKELLREEISKYIQTIQDPDLGFVTITEVKLSDDLCHSRVYYSVLGEQEQKKNANIILKNHIHPLRKFLGKKLTLRRIPEIKLIEDGTTEKASRIFSLLNQIREEKKSPSSSDHADNKKSTD